MNLFQLRIAVTLCVIVATATIGLCGPPPFPTPPGASVPIDGGLSVLIGAAMLIGVKKIFSKNN
jgi:hypothetical protein